MKYSQFTRLFVQLSLKSEIINFSSIPDIHYLINVMRKKIKDQILVFNQVDGEYLAEIKEINNKSISFKILEQVRIAKPEDEINLIFAPIKQSRLIFLLEKATELGVTKFTPIQTKHSVVDKINLSKWSIYLKEAAEQSNRISVPVINSLEKLDRFLTGWDKSKKIIFCNEKEGSLPFVDALKTIDNPSDINIMIGPEGGFSEQEISLLKSKDFIISSHLGERILRAETAAISAITLARYCK